MNKNRFRIVFSAVRGGVVVVAENVKSHTVNAEATANASYEYAHVQQPITTAASLNPLAFGLMLALGMAGFIPNTLSINTAYADIVADQTAPANQRPMVLNAINGVPLINIQTPSAAGVSRNTYSQFDVNANGAILNNSRTNVQTQLGGYVQGNPYLATGTARIILNEVNSHNPSLLNGYVEVAGSRAQVVIANPAGISCNGCGFINASRATLTTGSPIINNGDLMGYRVGGGVIHFLGAGLDTAHSNYTDVIARAVSVNAGLWAQDLNIVTGSNQVNVAGNGDVVGISTISPDASLPDGSSNTTPGFAVDVAALGGMYAGKIHLTGTETGVGVRNAGHIGASAGDVVVGVDGQLSNSSHIAAAARTVISADNINNAGGSITAVVQLNIDAAGLSGDGQLLSGGDVSITLTSDYTHTAAGELQADGDLSFMTTGNFTNQGNLLAGNELRLDAQNIQNAVNGEISGLHTYLNAADTLTNRGLIDGSNTFIHANTVNNIGTGSMFGDHLAIQANALANDAEALNGNASAAIMAARSRLDIGAANIVNQNNSLIFSAGDIAIGGELDANHRATASAGQTQAATLLNKGATIEALGSLSANVADLQNLNTGITTQIAALGTTAYDKFTPTGQGGIYNSGDYPLWQIGNFNMSWRYGSTYSLPFNFREYWRYVYTGSTSETQLVSSNPEKTAQILSGVNAVLNGNVTNSDSKIIAGGTLTQTGGSLNNLNTQGQTTTSYSGTAYYYDYDGNESCGDPGDGCYDISAAPYNPANSVTTFNLSTTAYEQNTAPAGTGFSAATYTPNALPGNSLFQVNPDPTGGYLIETNPRFANYRNWLSSDYMLSTLPLNPALTTKRVGDGFYEQRLIREQINKLTGQRFLAGYSDDEAQYQALMNDGITIAQSLQLIPGVTLTAAQVAQLTSDIVWLVEQELTLPDGSIAKALVPQVYVRLQSGDISNTGSLLAGQNIALNLNGDTINSGTLSARRVLSLDADNIHNLNGSMQGQQVSLTANQNINNLGGKISTQDTMMLKAGNNINIESTTHSAQNASGASSFSRINIDRVAGLYITNPTGAGLLVADAGNDINLVAAELVNRVPTAAGNPNSGQTILNTGNNLNFNTVKIAEQNNSVRNAKNYIKHGSTTDIGSNIQTTGDITLLAGNDLNAKAATITSDSGALTGMAGNNVNITAGDATSNMATARYKKKSGAFSSSKTTTRDTFNDSEVMGSNLSADKINLTAGAQAVRPEPVEGQANTGKLSAGNLAVIGSNVVATQDVNMNASGNVDIIAAQAKHDETHYKKVTKSGFTATSTSIGYGSSKLTNTNDSQQVMNVASAVGSVEGNVNITSGKTYTQTGSDVLTPQGDINVAAQQVNIVAATDTYASQQTMKYKQSGITLAITSPVISAIQTAQQMSRAAANTDNSRIKALAAGTTALAANNAKDAIIAGNTPQLDENGLQVLDANGNNTAENPANQVGGINVSLSIGTSKSSSKTVQTSTSAKSSHLTAGGDINITAVRPELIEGQISEAGNINVIPVEGIPTDVSQKSGNISVIGSQIKAAKDVTIKADDQINLQAAKNVDTLNSKNKNSSASVGVGVGTSGLAVTASASQGKGKTTGNGISWTETQIQSGNQEGETVTLESGTDTNIKGAQVTGNQVIANVDGNLNIESLQDTNQYKDKQKSAGISVSIPIGAGGYGGSISASNSKTTSNYASVNEQSGIMAGDSGFQVNVNGNTDLKGAVIASTDRAIQENKNSLTTQTLTTSNIENSAEYSAKGMGISAGVGLNQQPGGTGYKNTPTASAGSANLSGDSNSVTISGISGGLVNITDNTNQQIKTGKDSLTSLAILNRDVKTQFSADAQGNVMATAVDSQGNNLAGTLTPIFDQEQVQRELNAQIQITQAFSQVAPKAVGDYAGSKFKELTAQGNAEEAAKWDDGGVYRVALHTLVGGLAGNLEGAFGAGTSSAVIPIVGDEVAKLDIPEALKQSLMMATATAIGAGVGGQVGAGTALSEATNNYLTHNEVKTLNDKLKACKSSDCVNNLLRDTIMLSESRDSKDLTSRILYETAHAGTIDLITLAFLDPNQSFMVRQAASALLDLNIDDEGVGQQNYNRILIAQLALTPTKGPAISVVSSSVVSPEKYAQNGRDALEAGYVIGTLGGATAMTAQGIPLGSSIVVSMLTNTGLNALGQFGDYGGIKYPEELLINAGYGLLEGVLGRYSGPGWKGVGYEALIGGSSNVATALTSNWYYQNDKDHQVDGYSLLWEATKGAGAGAGMKGFQERAIIFKPLEPYWGSVRSLIWR